MADARVYQEQTEVAVGGQTADARVLQEQAEVGIAPPSDARVFQALIEVAQENLTATQFVLAVGIASAQQFGDVVVVQGEPEGLFPTAIPSGEAFGTLNLLYDQVVEPDPIGSEEDVNAIGIEGFLGPTGIPSQEAMGAAKLLSPYIYPIGIPGADQPGSPSVTGPTVAKTKLIRLNPGHRGIPSSEAVGTPTLTNKLIVPEGIASAETFGTPNLIVPQIITLTGIASAEAVGTPSIVRPDTVIPETIVSAEQVGTPAIVRAGVIEPTGIVSAEAFGTPELVTLEQDVLPEAITSTEIFGTPTIVQYATHRVIPTGIGTGLTFGTPTIVGAPNAPVQPAPIISRERFGLPRITVGIPEGPVNQAPGRIANRLYDPETGVAFAFAINHSDEDPRSYERTYEAGAPGAVGLARHQSAADPFRLSLRGTILDPAQRESLDTLFDHCDSGTLIYEDYSGEALEVIVTTWDCRPERGRNPVTRGLELWRYSMEMQVLNVLHGPILTILGAPLAVPADIEVLEPRSEPVLVGIASREAVSAPVILGGDPVVLGSSIASQGAFGAVAVSGGTTGPSPTAPVGIPGSWALLRSDEFNAPSLDRTLWRPGWFGDTISGPINTQYENCAYNADHVLFPGDGYMHLRVSETPIVAPTGVAYPYTGAVVSSNPNDGRGSGGFEFQYGAFEARMWLATYSPGRVANWPAFWTNGQQWPEQGEIDVMEGLGQGAEWHYHWNGPTFGGAPAGDWTGWHTFAAEWAPGLIVYYYDGVEVGRITTGVTAFPHHLILAHVVSKGPGDSTAPADCLVDYVRVWQRV